MAADAGGMIFRSIYEGCISGLDEAIERRPYHKNCGCALHDKSKSKSKKSSSCSHVRPPKCKTISYPIRRSWSEGSLAVHLSSSSSSPNLSSLSSSSSFSSLASPSCSPARVMAEPASRSNRLRWTIEEQDEDDEDGNVSVQGLNHH